MTHMHKVCSGVLIGDLLEQLNSKPELWNRYDFRTNYDTSPHREADDIVIRYRDFFEFDPQHPERFADKHESIWYAAYYELPALQPIIENLFKLADGEELGGVLITRIPAGKKVYPHSDMNCWHAQHYFAKVALILQSAPGQTFNFEGESHEATAGDVFFFNNHAEHWVENNSDIDRITLILAIKQKYEV